MPEPRTVELVGEIDDVTVATVERARIDEALSSGHAGSLCLDLSGVTFFDSTGLGLLVHARNACQSTGTPLTLRGVPTQVRQMLATTGMVRLFDFEYEHPTTEVDPGDLPTETPIPAGAVAAFDRIARLTARLLDVPTVTVTFVDQNGQVFPGAVGMREPAQSTRVEQLSHSLCKHVVARAAELVVTDLSADPLFAETPAALELEIRSYAGTPIIGTDGRVVGSLCAVRNEPSEWSNSQLADLRDLADIASGELQARESAEQSLCRTARLEAAHATVTAELLAAGQALERASAAVTDVGVQSPVTSSSAAV